jgi:hypothetical protein
MTDTALQNYKHWKQDCLNPAVEPATGFHGHGGSFAIPECKEYRKFSHEKPLDPGWDRVVIEGYLHPMMVDPHGFGEEPLSGEKPPRPPQQRLVSGAHTDDTLQQVKSKKLAQFFSRLAMALFGGLALIVPMLIMSLHQSRLTALLTTSVFIVAIGVILAWWMDDAQDKDIVAATAAYAAVLGVFVGVTLTPAT